MLDRTIYLVRHGEPESGYSGRYDIAPGPSLSQTGRYQARQAGLFLADRGLRRLYHSPLQRTVETAASIVTEVRRPSQAAAALREWERGELGPAVRARVVSFWEETIMRAPAPLALVSHGGPIDQLLLFLSDDTLDLSAHRYWGGAGTPLAGIWQADATESGWTLTLAHRPAPVTSA